MSFIPSACTPEEVQKIGCANGGTCFALERGPTKLRCKCADGFTGQRCLHRIIERDLQGTQEPSLEIKTNS